MMLAVKEETVRTIRLHLPNAREAFLLAEFNNWSTVATPLRHLGGCDWEASVPLGASLRGMAAFVLEQGRVFGRLCRLEDRGQ